jgi:1,4-dihydroxy-2-naphthoyl-CoA hydrolase
VAIAAQGYSARVIDPPVAVGPDRTLDAVLGFEILDADAEHARGRFAAEDRVKQPFGLVHGGALAAFAESLASMATYGAVAGDGMIAVGLSNHTSFLRPLLSGTVHAEARRRHRGRTTWLWEVDFTDDEGRLCAVCRVTMAVRPVPTTADLP